MRADVRCLLVVGLGAGIVLSACNGVLGIEEATLRTEAGAPAPGERFGPCFPNGTCTDGLECRDGLCLRPGDPVPEGGAPDSSSGGGDGAAGGGGGPFQSCDGLPKTCGGESGTDDCCASLLVKGGTFDRTYSNDGSGPTGQANPATVSDFRLDKYEVTVGRFRKYVATWKGGGGWTPPEGSGKHTHLNGGKGLSNIAVPDTYEPGWDDTWKSNVVLADAILSCPKANATWTPSVGANETRPMDCVNWYEAYAFCIWDGGFLPSEAESEYAAAGGSEQRQYPWGNAAPGLGNQYAIYSCSYPFGTGTCGTALNVAPVGTPASGAGRWGQLDLAGNVWEWNLDWLSDYGACTDCAFLTKYNYRLYRGGDYVSNVSELTPAFRTQGYPPGYRVDTVGFRCARSP